MNLETAIDSRLWNALKSSFHTQNYTASILDAIHFLSDFIRDKADLDGDGASLVGAALGGANPRLKVNNLRTESELNVQRGVEALLRGIYQAIRNPRSHGRLHDAQKDAVAIIVFIDYLLRVIDQSKSPFSVSAFLEKVFDQDFVPSERYARTLVERVPKSKLLSAALQILGSPAEVRSKDLSFLYQAILSAMTETEKADFLAAVSDTLASTDDEGTIIFIRRILPGKLWPGLDELARIRVEHKMIESVREGVWLEASARCTKGALGTWIAGIHNELALKDEFWAVVSSKLRSSKAPETAYVFQYFTDHAFEAFERPPSHLVRAVTSGLRNGDRRFKLLVESWGIDQDTFGRLPADHPWVKPFAKALAAYQEKAPEEGSEDDIPF
jgi:uncharacterized protein (TIGR02391 family)